MAKESFNSLVMGSIKFAEFPENSVAPPFLGVGQFHLSCFVDQNFVFSVETFSNELKANERHIRTERCAQRTNASRISPSHVVMRLGKTSNSKSVQIPMSNKEPKDFFEPEKEPFFTYFGIVRSNRLYRPPPLGGCNVHPSDGIGIAFGRTRSRMCRCDSPWCRPNGREQHVESSMAEVLSSPSDVHLWDLRIDQCKHIPHRHLCSTRIVRRHDIWYWHIDL